MNTKDTQVPEAQPADDPAHMSEAQQARYFEANADRLDEIFDTAHPVDLHVPDDATTTISVRLKASELDDLAAAAEARGKRLSTFVREAALTLARHPRATSLPGDSEALAQRFDVVFQKLDEVAVLLDLKAGRSGSGHAPGWSATEIRLAEGLRRQAHTMPVHARRGPTSS